MSAKAGEHGRVLDLATRLLHWSNVKDWMLASSGHGLGYESQTIESAFIRCPFCEHVLPPGSTIGGDAR